MFPRRPATPPPKVRGTRSGEGSGAGPTRKALVAASSGSFDPQGPVARVMEDLWWVMLWVGVAVFVLFLVLLVGGVLRRSRSEEPAATGTGAAEHGRWLLLGGFVLPTVVITAILGLTLDAMRATPDDAPAGALTIEIVGHQWWWEVRYPEYEVETANEIHIPAGRPVAFQLTSADVIHSFWVPQLGGKLDLLPEDTTTLVLEADEPGEFSGQCAEFCGLQHARMGLKVIAHTEDDFAAWLEDAAQPAAEPSGTAARGREVFDASGCAGCHAVRGTGGGGDGDGPDLTHLAARTTIAATTWPNDREHLADLIRRPQEVREGIDMPATELSDQELDALLTYLESLE